MASKKSNNEIISFSASKELAKDIDKLTKEIGYSNRSELVRDSIRMLKKSKLEIDKIDGMAEGVIIILYDHSVETEVSGIRHNNMQNIKSYMHTDFNERKKTCCDVLFISGKAKNIKKMLFDLETIKNVNEVKFSWPDCLEWGKTYLLKPDIAIQKFTMRIIWEKDCYSTSIAGTAARQSMWMRIIAMTDARTSIMQC